MDSAPGVAAPRRAWPAEFAAALRTQLENHIVGGSVALFAASALLRGFGRAAAFLRDSATDALFTRYDFPVGSPQVMAAARFLQSQPAMARASRRVVVDRRASRFGVLANARGAPQALRRARRPWPCCDAVRVDAVTLLPPWLG